LKKRRVDNARAGRRTTMPPAQALGCQPLDAEEKRHAVWCKSLPPVNHEPPSPRLSTFRLPPRFSAPLLLLPLSHFPSSPLSHCHTWPHQRKDNCTRSHCSTIPLSHPSPSPGPRAPRLLKEGSDGMLMTSRAYFTTSPLPPCSPGTQRQLAHLSFPLSQPPQRRASCLGVQQHIPLAHFPHTLRTQQRLAHLSFPLSHFPSLVQPPTLHTDMTWGFSTSHFPTSPPYPPITQRQLAHLSFTPWCPCLHSLVFVVRLTFLLSTESVTLESPQRGGTWNITPLGRPSQLLRRARRTLHSIRRSCCWCDALHTRGTWRALMLPTEGPRVRGRASALLGVAGRRMGRHRLLLCGGFTYYVRWRRWGRSAMRIGGCVRG